MSASSTKKLPSSGGNSLGLSRQAAESNAVCWSQDQRIAVAAADSIYVVTLKRPSLPQKKSVNEDSSVVLSTAPTREGYPLVSITYASAPLKETLASLQLEPISERAPIASLDPVLSGKGSSDQIRFMQWSPVGFNKDGGCVLTAVTMSGRLLLYTPPGCTALSWRMVDVSPFLVPLFLSQLETATQPIVCEPSGSKMVPITTSSSSNTKEKKSKKSGPKKSAKTTKNQSEGTPKNQTEGSSKKRTEGASKKRNEGPSKNRTEESSGSHTEGASNNQTDGAPKDEIEGASEEAPENQLEEASSNQAENTSKSQSKRGPYSNDRDSVEGPRPKKAKLAAALPPEIPDELTQRRLAVAATTCSWLPTWLLVPGGGVIGVIALATRGGQLSLIGVKLPINVKKDDTESTPTLFCYYKLPFSVSDSSAWCSSLLWLPAPVTTTTTSSSSSSSSSLSTPPPSYLSPSPGCVQGQLVAGCTNGQVFRLQVLLRGVAPPEARNSDTLMASDCAVATIRCEGDIDQIGACVQLATPIWEEPDSIPVHSMACHSKFSSGVLWLAFAKSSVVMAAKLNHSYDQVGPCVQVESLHTMTVSGISAYSPTSFISSSVDGSVQTFSLSSSHIHDHHVTPSAVVIETPEKIAGVPVVTSLGVSSSENGLMAAVAINFPMDRGKTKQVIKLTSRLSFVTLASEKEVEELVRDQPSGHWDVCECVRRHYVRHQALLAPVKEMWANLTKGRFYSFNKLRLLLYANIMMGKRDETERCRKEITKRHTVNSLRNWAEWEKRNEQKKGTENFMEKESLVCLQLMASWLLSNSTSHLALMDLKTANRIMDEYATTSPDDPVSKENPGSEDKPGSRDKPGSKDKSGSKNDHGSKDDTGSKENPGSKDKQGSKNDHGSEDNLGSKNKSGSKGRSGSKDVPISRKLVTPQEQCPACSEPISFKNLMYDMCGHGHRWSRCGLTMMLAADARCSCCLQCGSAANNTVTMATTPGSWLDELLRHHSCCIYCGGYFEQVV